MTIRPQEFRADASPPRSGLFVGATDFCGIEIPTMPQLREVRGHARLARGYDEGTVDRLFETFQEWNVELDRLAGYGRGIGEVGACLRVLADDV